MCRALYFIILTKHRNITLDIDKYLHGIDGGYHAVLLIVHCVLLNEGDWKYWFHHSKNRIRIASLQTVIGKDILNPPMANQLIWAPRLAMDSLKTNGSFGVGWWVVGVCGDIDRMGRREWWRGCPIHESTGLWLFIDRFDKSPKSGRLRNSDYCPRKTNNLADKLFCTRCLIITICCWVQIMTLGGVALFRKDGKRRLGCWVAFGEFRLTFDGDMFFFVKFGFHVFRWDFVQICNFRHVFDEFCDWIVFMIVTGG